MFKFDMRGAASIEVKDEGVADQEKSIVNELRKLPSGRLSLSRQDTVQKFYSGEYSNKANSESRTQVTLQGGGRRMS